MPAADLSSTPPQRLALLLDALLDELVSAGFPRAGIALRLRLARLIVRFSARHLPTAETLKYQLAALCCHSAEEQEKFYRVFDGFIARQQAQAPDSTAKPLNDDQQKQRDKEGSDTSQPVRDLLAASSNGPASTLPAAARYGPIALELTFYDDGFRPWNLPDLEPIVRAWREKEWTLAEDWDIPASIRRTIRAGGLPHFTRRRRRKAPQYLFLIEQHSHRDHLAALHADLVLELQRRDVDADYYFYSGEPHHCWKDRRNAAAYVTLEQLLGAHDGARLILIGEPEGLLHLPDLRPTWLVLRLQEDWPAVALLCTRSTAAWGALEAALSRYFPVAPANLAGLSSLLGQWLNRQSYTRAYWQEAAPEPVLPDLSEAAIQSANFSKIIRHLRVYLGKQGFNWLCAVAVYPELYWPLTKLLHDEAVPPAEVPDEGLRRQVWLFALRRLVRLPWLRQGALPPKLAVELRELLAPASALAVRTELLKVLGLEENNKLPDGSYARQDRAYTVALLEHEQAIGQPERTDSQRLALEAAFRERVEREQISLTDIAHAVGRAALHRLLPPPPISGPGFHVLWVDDEPKNNARFQEELNELMHVVTTTATSTEEALAKLGERGFDLIVSDVSRYRREDEGANMLRDFREKGVTTPVIFYTTTHLAEKHAAGLRELGAAEVFSSKKDLQKFIGDRVMERQRPTGSSFSNLSPENMTQAPQQQVAAPRPDERVAAAEAAQQMGDEAMATQNYAGAASAYQEAMTLFTAIQDDAGRANTHQALGKLALATNDLEGALQHFQSASTLYLMLNLQPAYAFVLMDIGNVQHRLQRLTEARQPYQEALEILEDIGYGAAIAEVNIAMAGIAQERKDYPDARKLLENALKVVPNLDDNAIEAKIRKQLGIVYQEMGNLNEATIEFRKSLQIYEGLKNQNEATELKKLIYAIGQKIAPPENPAKQNEGLRERIQALIGAGRLEEALNELVKVVPDAILLKGQYNAAKRENSLGLLDGEDWRRTLARLNNAALELVRNLDNTASTTPPAPQRPVSAVPKFFMVADSADEKQCAALSRHLTTLKRTNRIRIFNPLTDLVAGENFSDRIQKELTEADYILVLVSADLLSSEQSFALVHESLEAGRRIIPILLRKADVEGTGLERLRSLPTMGRTISDFKNPDEAYADIVSEIRKLLPNSPPQSFSTSKR